MVSVPHQYYVPDDRFWDDYRWNMKPTDLDQDATYRYDSEANKIKPTPVPDMGDPDHGYDDPGHQSGPDPAKISLEIPQDQSDKIPLDTAPTQYNSPENSDTRARKIKYGFGDNVPDVDTLRFQIQTGNEPALRFNLANLKSTMDYNKNIQYLRNLSAASDGAISVDEINQVQALAKPVQTDPFSVMEEQYVSRLINDSPYINMPRPNPIREALDSNAKETGIMADKFWDIGVRRELARTQEERVNDRISKSDWGPYLLNKALSLSQIASWVQINYALKDYDDAIRLPGDSLQAKVDGLLHEPSMAVYKQRLEETVRDLEAINPETALWFLKAIQGRSQEENFIDNITGGMTAVGVAAKGLQKVARAATALKDLSKGSAAIPPKATTILNELGEVKEAGKVEAAEHIENTPRVLDLPGDNFLASQVHPFSEPKEPLPVPGPQAPTPDTMEKFNEILPSGFRADRITSDLGSHGREYAERLKRETDATREDLFTGLKNVPTPETLTPEARDQAIANSQANLLSRYSKIGDTNYDLDVVPVKDSLSGAYNVEFRLGYQTGELIPTEKAAKDTADFIGLKKGEYEIKQKGLNYYISITKPLNEYDNLGNLLIGTNNKVQRGWFTDMLSSLTGGYGRRFFAPDYTQSQFNQAYRLLSTYAPGAFRETIYKTMRDTVGKLSKSEWNDLGKILRYNNEMEHPELPGQRGYYYQTVGELDRAYMQTFHRLPTDDEQSAYWAVVRTQGDDLVLRNLAMYRMKIAQGTERWRLRVPGSDASYFDGIWRKELPSVSRGDGYVLHVTRKDKDGGKMYNLSDPELDPIRDDIAKGKYQVIEIHSPRSRPLNDSMGQTGLVNFVVTDGGESAPLRWQQIPDRPGGHVEYEGYSHYIKQARFMPQNTNGIFRNWYVGDTTFLPIANEAQGRKWVPILEESRKLLNEGDMGAFEKHARDNFGFIPYEAYRDMWKERTVNGKKQAAYLDKDRPFELVPNRRTTQDVNTGYYTKDHKDFIDNYKDATDSPYDAARNISVEFTGERSEPLYQIGERGSKFNPVFTWEPANTIDPLPMLKRATDKAVQSRFLDPYQQLSVQSWIREFRHLLTDPDKALNNPLYYFHNPKYISGADKAELGAAKASNFQIKQFLGYRSESGQVVDQISAKLINQIYKVAGPDAANYATGYLAPGIKDFDKYVRSFAFHTTVGLWNPSLFFLHAQTFLTSSAIAGPQHAPAAFFAMGHSWMLRHIDNPDWIKQADQRIANSTKWLGKYGWKNGEFEEAHNAMAQRGFNIVGDEQALLNTWANPSFYRSTLGNVLDAGKVFFENGVQFQRLGAWHLAYKEYKAENNIVGKLSDEDWNAVFRRADDLSLNMSRASVSMENTGLLSIPFQFYTVHKRYAELMLGNKLTQEEKVRVIMAQALAYGLPTAVSGAVGVPLYESLRAKAMEKGQDLHENFFNKMMFDGLLAAGLFWATGREVDLRGKYGISGISQIHETLANDKGFWELMTGAAGTAVGKAMSIMNPGWQALGALFRQDGSSFPATWDDVQKAGETINTVFYGGRAWVALNQGKWINRNHQVVLGNTPETQVGPMEGVTMSLLGLQPQWATDASIKGLSARNQKELWDKATKQIVHEIQNALDAGNNNDDAGFKTYMTRANALFQAAGIPMDQQAKIIHEAVKGDYSNILDRIDERFWKMGSDKDREARLQQLLRERQLRQKLMRQP